MGWLKRLCRVEKPVRKVGWGRIEVRAHLYTKEKIFRKQLRKLLVHITDEEVEAAVSKVKQSKPVYALVDEDLYRRVSKGKIFLNGIKSSPNTPGNCCSNGGFLNGQCSCGIHEDSDRFDYLIITPDHADETGWQREIYYSD